MSVRAQHIHEVEDKVKASLYVASNSSFVLSILMVLILAVVFAVANRP